MKLIIMVISLDSTYTIIIELTIINYARLTKNITPL